MMTWEISREKFHRDVSFCLLLLPSSTCTGNEVVLLRPIIVVQIRHIIRERERGEGERNANDDVNKDMSRWRLIMKEITIFNTHWARTARALPSLSLSRPSSSSSEICSKRAMVEAILGIYVLDDFYRRWIKKQEEETSRQAVHV